MLKKIRHSTFSNFFLALLIVCLFFLAKTKAPQTPSAPPAAPEPMMPLMSQALPLPEIAPPEVEEEPFISQRVFAKQLNRHRRVLVAARKTSKRIAKTPKKIESAVLNEIAENGLSESPQGATFNVDPYESETLLDPNFSLAASIPREKPLNIYEGVLVANDTASLWETLDSFPAAPELAMGIKEASPELEPVVERPGVVISRSENLKPMQAVPSEIQSIVDQGKNLLESIQKTLIPAPTPKPPQATTQPKKNSNQNIIPGVEPSARISNQPVGRVFGKLSFDEDVQDWLDGFQGHVELKLQRTESRDPQDAFFVDYEYPETEFSWDGREVTGGYQLVASFFSPKKSVPVAQVVYPTLLTAESAKRRVVFHIRKNDVDEATRTIAARNHSGVVLSGTVFEASPADHKSEKTVAAAEVSVVGYPNWGVYHSEPDGTFRIPHVSANSEFKLQVTAKGYYPTQVVVPVFQTTGYVSVHLVSKQMVDAITGFFTKKGQSEAKALIMGRVFDPETRAPQSDQEINLSGRPSSALYFKTLPDLSLRKTSSAGSFAYFNVDPAFRSLGKTGSSVSHLLEVKPGSAYFLESGRGGNGYLRGKLFDPYRNQPVPGLIKIVGASTRVGTNEAGEFEIRNIDLPPGVITIEVEAEGYPISWHTLPWSTRDGDSVHTFYLPESDLLEEARSAVARVSKLAQRGTILGGAQSSFFRKDRQCVTVSLETSEGKPVSTEHGPFPILRSNEKVPQKRLCLSSSRPGFAFYNLPAGEYVLKWQGSKGEMLRTHVTRVGSERVSILIN